MFFPRVDTSEGKGLVASILSICKDCLFESGRTRDGAAYLLSRLLTRPDMEDDTLVEFLRWSDKQLQTTKNTFVRAV